MSIDYQGFPFPKAGPGKLRVEEKRQKRLDDESQEAKARREARERYGYLCAVPGCKERYLLHLHHLERRSQSKAKRWQVENLAFLCPAHHQLKHAGRIHLQRDKDGELIVTGDVKALKFRL